MNEPARRSAVSGGWWYAGYLFAKSRGGRLLLPILAVATLAVLVAPRGPVGVPLRIHAYTFAGPMALSLAGMMAIVCLQAPNRLVEFATRRLAWVRAVWWCLLVCACAVPGLLLAGVDGYLLALRQTLLVFGFGTVVAIGVPQVFAWVAPASIVAVTALYGWRETLEPQWWAILAYPGQSVLAFAIALSIGVASCLAYATRDVASGEPDSG